MVEKTHTADAKLMAFLSDGPEIIGVGRMLCEVSPAQLLIAKQLASRGWVQFYSGWRSVYWAKLTPKGLATLYFMRKPN